MADRTVRNTEPDTGVFDRTVKDARLMHVAIS